MLLVIIATTTNLEIKMTLNRYDLEKIALEKAPKPMSYDLADMIDRLSDDHLHALINADVFVTDEPRMLIKMEYHWTDGSISFEDRDGLPWDDSKNDYFAGSFELSSFDLSLYQAITSEYRHVK